MRLGRVLVLVLALGVAVAGGFLVPTLWGQPWSIDHLYHRILGRFLLQSPMLLSQLRVLEPMGIDFHSDDLDDFSSRHARERAAWVASELAVLRSFDRDALASEAQRSYDVMEWFLDGQVRGEPYLFHDYPINQFEGVQSRLPDFLLNVHRIDDLEGARDYVTRLGKVDVALDQAVAGMRDRRDQGVVPPRFVLERVRGEVEGFLAEGAARHELVLHLDEAVADLPVSSEDRESLRAAAQDALDSRVFPAYRRLLALLDELELDAVDDPGVWRLPGGEAYYAWLLRQHTTSELDADAIHQLGLAETARIQDEIRTLLAGEGIDATDIGATLRELHRDPRFLYSDDDAGRAQILADYQAIMDEAQGRLPETFSRLPASAVVVERIPEFKEGGAPGAYYRPPAMDGSRPGVFYANLRATAETPRFGMRTLAYHEAVPGHHLQIALAMENDGLPLFRRLLPFNAYSEGWALYAERLAAEEGYHPTALDRVGQLVAELFRAVRLVVDTGIHAKRWSREEAITYMADNTGMPETDVVAEIERYIVIPGQATGYKVGQLEILRLRERARTELGEDFDLPGFHEAVLGGGGLPLVLLGERVDAWIEASR